MIGWIRIHRQIQEHWIWKDPVKLRWWLDILLNVNFVDSKVNIGFNLYECKRGQSIRSLQTWADRWGVSKDTARNFLTLLGKDGMILHENIGKSTRITVCNYDSYQGMVNDTETQSKRQVNATETLTAPKQELKEDNNDINISFDVFWEAYGKKVGNKKLCIKRWNKLKDQERQTIIDTLPSFLKSISDKKYLPYPEKYLNERRWEDEISIPPVKNNSPVTPAYIIPGWQSR